MHSVGLPRERQTMQDPNSALNLGPVQKTTLVEAVMEQIIALMRDGHLHPGDKLPSERTLMAMMNVGRSTVREALQGLVALNLIETRSGQGSRVKTTPPHLIDTNGAPLTVALQRDLRLQLLDMRQLVEGTVAVWAIERATESEIEALKRHLDGYEHHSMIGDWPNSHMNHQAFHRALAEASHNVIAVRVVDSLITTMPQSLVTKFVSLSEEVWEEERRVHRKIYNALRERDEALMRVAITEHMEAERRQILAG